VTRRAHQERGEGRGSEGDRRRRGNRRLPGIAGRFIDREIVERHPARIDGLADHRRGRGRALVVVHRLGH